MKIDSLTMEGFYAYLSGKCRGEAHRWMAVARNAHYEEAKRLYVNWARAENHASMRYMKLAQQARKV
jgi:hypothetical protein